MLSVSGEKCARIIMHMLHMHIIPIIMLLLRMAAVTARSPFTLMLQIIEASPGKVNW